MGAHSTSTSLTAALVALLWAADVRAQTVSLDIRDGVVTLIARDVSLERILAEWSRVGGLQVTVRGDGFSSTPITLLLRDLTEREALDILLRDVGGYLLVAKQETAHAASAFERIVIVPARGEVTSTGDRPEPSQTRAARARARVQSPAADPFDTVSALPRETSEIRASSGSDTGGLSSDVGELPTTPEGPEALDVPAEARDRNAAPRPSSDDLSGAPDTEAGPPPPTPMQRPQPVGPSAGNPFGGTSAARPGGLSPVAPPPGVVYPPVTNPNAHGPGFTPGGVRQ